MNDPSHPTEAASFAELDDHRAEARSAAAELPGTQVREPSIPTLVRAAPLPGSPQR